MHMSYKLVIIVPTKNRINWCVMKLKFYARMNYKVPILFLDASESNNEFIIKGCAKKLNYCDVHYLHVPNKSIHLSIEDGLNYAFGTWNYFVISGDDDFHLPKSLAKAVKFLDKNEEFVAVTGKALITRIRLSSNKIFILSNAFYWKAYSNINENTADRFSLMLNNYINLEFAVKRLDAGLIIATAVNKFTGTLTFQESGFAEYCTATSIPFLGKVYNFNSLFMVRGDHSDRPFSRGRTYRRPQFNLDLNKGFKNFSKFAIGFCIENNIGDLDTVKSALQKRDQKMNKKKIKKYFPILTPIRRRALSIMIRIFYHRVLTIISQT